MSNPLTMRALTGTIVGPDGSLAQGEVTFTPVSEVPIPDLHLVIGRNTSKVDVVDGHFEAELAVTDQGLIQGWYYRAVFSLGFPKDDVFIQLPSGTGALDLSEVQPVTIDGTKLYIQGDKGDTGDSAYQLAVKHGYAGTEAEWLAEVEADRLAAQAAAQAATDARNDAVAQRNAATLSASNAASSAASALASAGAAASAQSAAEARSAAASGSADEASASASDAGQTLTQVATLKADVTSLKEDVLAAKQAVIQNAGAAITAQADALASKDAAAESAGNAAESETAAAESAASALAAQSAATAARDASVVARDATLVAKTAAEAAATSASGSATAAAGSATAAASSASTAATKATEAASSATGAAASAATATGAASTLNAAATAIAGTSTGLLTHTAAGNNYAPRTIVGTTNQVTVTNGNGVSGNPTLSLPQDIHSTAIPTFAGERLPVLANRITNGDFSSGVGSWGVDGSTLSVVSGKLRITSVSGDYACAFVPISPLTAGNFYYLALTASPSATESLTASNVYVGLGASQGVINVPSGAATTRVSAVFTVSAALDRLYYFPRVAAGQYADIGNIVLIDLTGQFGAGNEPTIAEMDRIMGYFGNSWFDGTADITTLLKALAGRHEPFQLRNLISNGDFSAGSGGFGTNGCSTAVASNVLTATGAGTQATPNVYTQPSGTLARRLGQKAYIRGMARTASAACTKIELSIAGDAGNVLSQSSPTVGQWYTGSAVVKFTNDNVATIFTAIQTYPDAATSNGGVMEIKYILALDLTALFGAGNEPTAAEMDNLLSMWPNSWFNGYGDPAKFSAWIMSRRIRFGTGSPLSVISAPVGTEYIDTAITTGAAKWRKNSGTDASGWVVSDADTGKRNILADLLVANGWVAGASPLARLRRIGKTVFLTVAQINRSALGSGNMFNLPSGFQPADSAYVRTYSNNTAYVAGSVLFANYNGQITESGFTLTFATDDAWPTTLPGTAA